MKVITLLLIAASITGCAKTVGWQYCMSASPVAQIDNRQAFNGTTEEYPQSPEPQYRAEPEAESRKTSWGGSRLASRW